MEFLESLPLLPDYTKEQSAAVLALAALVVLALVVFLLLYVRQRRVCRRIAQLADTVHRCQEEVRTVASASLFAETWSEMAGAAEAIAAWKGRIRLWDRSIDLEAMRRRVQDLGENYQWWMRDAIERQKERALAEVRTLYRNSPDRKETVYTAFAADLEGVCALFDGATCRYADSALEEVYRAAGCDFPRHDAFAPPQRAVTEEDIAAKLRWCDDMEGRDFEYFCADLLRRNGFTDVTVTSGSGDQGVDILAQKDDIRYAVQCKCYAADLGNTPVQEIHAGKEFYDCHVGAVMTNRGFTPGARQAAKRTRTLLWGREKLAQFLANAEE